MDFNNSDLHKSVKMFRANGVIINKPFKTSEGKIIVLDKETQKKVVLHNSKAFSPKHHEWIPEISTKFAEKETSTKPAVTQQSGLAEEDLKLFFQELKEIGWKDLDKEQKAEYVKLKKLYGQE